MTSEPSFQFPSHDLARDEAALDRYCAGECTPRERMAIDAWLEANPLKRAAIAAVVEAARRAMNPAAPPPVFEARELQADFWRLVHARNSAQVMETTSRAAWARQRRSRVGESKSRRFYTTHARLGLVAGLVCAIGLGWWAVRMYQANRVPPTAMASSAREIHTKRGERAALDLADGTHVILAPASRLRIPDTYTAGTGHEARDLELDGEAYFEVKHDAARPFRVRTAAGIAEDLGTAFVVTAYPEMYAMGVLVASGEVAIHRATLSRTNDTLRSPRLALLQAGDLAQLDSLGTLRVRHGVNVRAQLSWASSGRLIFVDAPLSDVITVLQHWYDLEFRLSDPALAALRVTMTFNGSSVDAVVDALELTLKVRSERHGRVVTFLATRRPSTARTDSAVIPPSQGTGIR